jgi:hypothetical protein
VTELVIRGTLRTTILSDWRTFCKEFDIPEADYREAFGGKPRSMHSLFQNDVDDLDYQSQDERFSRLSHDIAKQRGIAAATWYYQERLANFGIIDQLRSHFGLLRTGVFARFQDYYRWSRWDKVLFLASVPRLDEWSMSPALVSNNAESDKSMARWKRVMFSPFLAVAKYIKHSINLITGSKKGEEKVLNLTETDADSTPLTRFLQSFREVISFQSVFKSIGVAVGAGNYIVIPFRILDGIIDWFAHVYQLAFPFILALFLYFDIACY